ncbi:hypothetical protein Pmani_019883 [Petrolisthes manimaculis]|uniref:Uncharacterized protein n=1 Tax=Petrolisthes manimaculis TaxID=1843537 RepID=A0AAE1PHB1_9EUCA|nr:hypothetical protein Pmani_019883 [Petrolisthes manimaculis]
MQRAVNNFITKVTGSRGGNEEAPNPEDLLRDHLGELSMVEQPGWVTLEELIEKSESFPIPFRVQTTRVVTLHKSGHDKDKLEEQINSAYPLIHEKVLPLLAAFLHHKRIHGSKIERRLYQKTDLLGLVERLLKKRTVVFVNSYDRYYLWDKSEGCGGFEVIGTNSEEKPLILADYMSYDEMKISALLCVSSHSTFINDGRRENHGIPGDSGSFQPDGVIVGMVGPRMHREEVMEYQDIVITPQQNKKARGFGKDSGQSSVVKIWEQVWETELPTWHEAHNSSEDTFLYFNPQIIFNKGVYKKRIQMSAEILLIEASVRAGAVGLQAYIHVVGLGLGVWRFYRNQEQLYVEAWGDTLKAIETPNIAHVDFSWIEVDNCHGIKNGEVFPGTNITLHFSRRALHAPVPSGTLLVTNFAWDSNTLPGNEYWLGSLTSSGDPAAACSSGVAELHNTFINPRVTSTNLHIVSRHGIEHVAKYAQRLEQQQR